MDNTMTKWKRTNDYLQNIHTKLCIYMAKFTSNFICCATFSNTNLSLNTYSTTFKYLMNPSNMFDDIFKTVICVFETSGAEAKKNWRKFEGRNRWWKHTLIIRMKLVSDLLKLFFSPSKYFGFSPQIKLINHNWNIVESSIKQPWY